MHLWGGLLLIPVCWLSVQHRASSSQIAVEFPQLTVSHNYQGCGFGETYGKMPVSHGTAGISKQEMILIAIQHGDFSTF